MASSIFYNPGSGSSTSGGTTVFTGPVTFQAPASFPDGSAAAPSITFTSSPSTGWYFSPPNQLSAAILGTEVVRMSGTSYVWLKNDLLLGAPGSMIRSTVDGKFVFGNDAVSSGIGLDVTTDAVFKVQTRALNAYGTVDALAYSRSGVILISGTAPTIASGFGVTPSIVASNGANVFTINVGTGGTAQNGVITMPTAPNGWAAQVTDLTTNASFVTDVSATSATSITLQNYSRTTGLAIAWTASNILQVIAFPY